MIKSLISIQIRIYLWLTFLFLVGCYSKTKVIDQSNGNIIVVKKKYKSSSGLKIEKGKIFTSSGKLLEKSKYVTKHGTWQELVESDIIRYDTINGNWCLKHFKRKVN